MAERPIEELTLRELFIGAERQARELVEHLELNFVPKVDGLAKLVRPPRDTEDLGRVPDLTVRTAAAEVLESETYTDRLYNRLEAYFQAIDKEVNRIVGGT